MWGDWGKRTGSSEAPVLSCCNYLTSANYMLLSKSPVSTPLLSCFFCKLYCRKLHSNFSYVGNCFLLLLDNNHKVPETCIVDTF